MSEDPSIKEALSSTKSHLIGIGKGILNAKIPIRKAVGIFKYIWRERFALIICISVLVLTFAHYGQQIEKGQCEQLYRRSQTSIDSQPDLGEAFSKNIYGNYASMPNLDSRPSITQALRGAIELSPIYQFGALVYIRSHAGEPDPFYSYYGWMRKNNIEDSYRIVAAGSINSTDALRRVEYLRSQNRAICLSKDSFLLVLIIFSHALFSFLFVASLPWPRRNDG